MHLGAGEVAEGVAADAELDGQGLAGFRQRPGQRQGGAGGDTGCGHERAGLKTKLRRDKVFFIAGRLLWFSGL